MESKPKKSQFRWYDATFLRVIPPLVALLIKLLMISCRVTRVEGLEREKDAFVRSGGRIICATWHQRMPYHFHYFGSRHVTTMISQSRDGEYAARIAGWLGFKNVRGSSTRGGFKALKELIQRIKKGETGGMLADGPLGPARVAKIGSIVLARNSEAALLPILWGADRCWLLNTWDRYLIPKPFARVVVYYCEPILIPRSAKGDELEKYRRLFEERLNEGTRWCDEQFGRERPWRKVKKEGVPEIGPLKPPNEQKSVDS
ncbi:MAG: lysophospholipid acyltransferase family protein [Deltaproteobacteria bacterium]|nr:lysophospholipid acyltransferase family protein [Deltaproteobacteria bacterium]